MAYGITSKSQLIDIETIKAACAQYKVVLDDFERCGNQVINAGDVCSPKALSVDDESLQPSIIEIGEQIKGLKDTFAAYADQVEYDAVNVYNAQVLELNEYNRKLQQQKNG